MHETIEIEFSPFHAEPVERFVVLGINAIEHEGAHKILQLSVVDVSAAVASGQIGGDTMAWSCQFNPGFLLLGKDSFITGLFNHQLQDRALFKDKAWDLRQFIGDATLIGHNIDADLAILNAEMSAAGLKPFANKTICTLALAKKVLPYANKKQKYHGDWSMTSLLAFVSPKVKPDSRVLVQQAIATFSLFWTLNFTDTTGVVW